MALSRYNHELMVPTAYHGVAVLLRVLIDVYKDTRAGYFLLRNVSGGVSRGCV